MKRNILILFFIMSFIFFGCASPGLQPKDWAANNKPLKKSFADGSFFKSCDDIAKTDPNQAKLERNVKVGQVAAGIDDYYSAYREKLIKGNAWYESAFSIGQIFATAISGSPWITDVDVLHYLALGSTMAASSKAVIDKNFLQNQGVALLVLKMDKIREINWKQIKINLDKSYEEYPIEMAMKDLTDYFNSGTLIGALLNQ